MSEIKGQLLGIILTLMVFAAVSVTIAAVYKRSASSVTQRSEGIEDSIDTELTSNSLLHY